MPRVYTQKANKDYPGIGVKKGEVYYKWQCYGGPVQSSKTYPRPTQLSGAKTAVVEEAVEDAKKAVQDAETPEAITEAIESCGSTARDTADEYTESADNIEQTFPGSPTADECREKADALGEFANECEGFSPDTSDYEAIDGEEFRDSEIFKDALEKWQNVPLEERTPSGEAMEADVRTEDTFQDGVKEHDEAFHTWEADRDERLAEALNAIRTEAEEILDNYSL